MGLIAALALAALIVSAAPASAGETGWEVSARAGYFDPSDLAFRSFYVGGPIYGLSVGWMHSTGMGVRVGTSLFATSTRYRSRTEEAMFFPTTASMIYLPLNGHRATPVIGAGFGLYSARDHDLDTGKSQSWFAFGYHGLAGVRIRAVRGLFAEIDIQYDFARADKLFHADMGGWTSTIGLGCAF